MDNFDIIIIGKGPAGVSASLYTSRAGLKTAIIAKDDGALEKAEKIENYYGFESIKGSELVSSGISQAKRLGVEFITEEVVGLGFDEKLSVKTNQNTYLADCVIIAAGSPRTTPKINGIEQFEENGISYCAVCDAFFHRGKDVAIIGCCEYALSEAKELLPVVKSVTLLTNGNIPKIAFPKEITINTKKIKALTGKERLESVLFEDDTALSVSGVFVAYGTAGSAELAGKIGAATNNNKIVVDENMSTGIPGIYAAGDCTGGMLQIAKAVYEGAKAGSEAIKYIRSIKKK